MYYVRVQLVHGTPATLVGNIVHRPTAFRLNDPTVRIGSGSVPRQDQQFMHLIRNPFATLLQFLLAVYGW